MSKDPNVSRILSQGSPRQRAMLMANHIAEHERDGKGFLTDAEMNALSKTFKKQNEIELYNRINRDFRAAQTFLVNLSQMRLACAEAIASLDRLVIIKKTNLDIEEIANGILLFIDNKKAKKKAAAWVAERYSNASFYRSIQTNESGLLALGVGYINMIEDEIKHGQERVQTEQANLKTAIKAIRDFLDDTGLTVKVFRAFIKDVDMWARSGYGRGPHLRVTKAQRKKNESHKMESRLLDHNIVEPDFDSVEIDPELYAKFKKEYLNG